MTRVMIDNNKTENRMLTKTKVDCEECGKSFNGSHGVTIHHRRSACGGNKVADNSPKNLIKASKEEIKRILANYPEGLTTQNITAKLKKQGFQINASDYVAKTAGGDPECIRVKRGTYRLKENSQTKTFSKQETLPTPKTTSEKIHSQTLQLHIENVENHNKTLKEIIILLLKGL